MLVLKNITKDYTAGDTTVRALRGLDLTFREHEFVSVLGPSGCGKTTLLNIIGGLDKYTSGDLIINGRSTKDYKDSDWDSYRNHSIGFVFQSYNLIPHQTVLSNVELALTLSGVSKAERRKRAVEVLTRVGLADQLHKKPNQMSGGQMQRVAIARALVNDPDILLADEPTGALDTETSVQIMDLLREISHDKLIIMVTHNPDLAAEYSSRTIKLLDGSIIGDTNPYEAPAEAPEKQEGKRQRKKPSMSFFTALSLSLNNLMTKKARTFLTSFAGSIGIIGIALILSLSTGINSYINQVQQDTLSSYPITIEAETLDMTAMMTSFMGANQSDSEAEPREDDRVYSSTVMYDLLNTMVNAETQTNNLKAFKAYLDNGGGGIDDLATIRYGYDFDFDIYTEDADGNVVKSDVMTLMQEAMTTMYGGDYSSFFNSSMGSMYETMDVWEELLPGEDGQLVADQVLAQYDLLYGSWPQAYDEVILFVDSRNEISDLMLYALGYISADQMSESLEALMNSETLEAEQLSWSYEDLCQTNFKLILPAEYYQHDAGAGGYVDMSETETGMNYLYNSSDVGTKLKIVGVARPSEEAAASMVTGAIGYTSALTTYAMETTEAMDIVTEQMADESTDVFSGLPFATGEEQEPSDAEKEEAIRAEISAMDTMEKADVYLDLMSQAGDDYVAALVEQQMAGMTREAIEEMIVEQYAGEMGVDASTIQGYISEMSDDELFSQVEDAIALQIREQYGESVRQQLSSMTQEQLAAALDFALSEEAALQAQPVQTPAEEAQPSFGDNMAITQLPEGYTMPEGMAVPEGYALPEGYTGVEGMTAEQAALTQQGMAAPQAQALETWQYNYLYDNYMPPTVSESSFEENMDLLGYVDMSSPSSVSIYASTFADKDEIAARIEDYNNGVENEEDQISYTDYVALLMSSITDIISGISYLLIAFVSISLIVSSIMIGIITYISVLERTKEIGILRSIGASKRDISRVFNAETLIVGLCAGLIGIGMTLILIIPINAILLHFTGLVGLKAALPAAGGVILVVISMLLTFVAGLIPSRIAARKDPVVALRTE